MPTTNFPGVWASSHAVVISAAAPPATVTARPPLLLQASPTRAASAAVAVMIATDLPEARIGARASNHARSVQLPTSAVAALRLPRATADAASPRGWVDEEDPGTIAGEPIDLGRLGGVAWERSTESGAT